MMPFPLKGKVALITGGSRGLGAATAGQLAELGADIAITYLASAAKAQAVLEQAKARGVRALAIQSDQADTAAAKHMVGQVLAHFVRLDILVNNAAIAVQGKTVDDPALDKVNLDRQWQINVMGTGGHDARRSACAVRRWSHHLHRLAAGYPRSVCRSSRLRG
jgi:3-oxoacyl-[acyl-carrier protein] reductase